MASINLCTLSFLLLISFLASSPIPSLSHTPCNSEDHNGLVAISTHFNQSLWTLDDPNCCSWYGITCDLSTGRVISLFVKGAPGLSGTLPPSISDLPFLQNVVFRRLPNLTGTIPSTFAKLTMLSTLDLSHNSLSGPIPSFLSNITSLTYLSLSRNKFTGRIPSSLSNLTNLTDLELDRNQLTGSIPESFGSFPSKDSPMYLDLSHNSLSGPIPASLGVPSWINIDVSSNQLTGDASVLFGASKPTQNIDISHNQFEFDLTGVAFPVGLYTLDMNQNAITGSIPAQINSVTRLGLFNVSYNRLCGVIPAGPVTAQFDQSAYLHNKCLCGAPLPAC